MEKYKSLIIKVGKAKQMEPAVIAAIISRESRAGAVLKDGWGDRGNGFGLMQVGMRTRCMCPCRNTKPSSHFKKKVLAEILRTFQLMIKCNVMYVKT